MSTAVATRENKEIAVVSKDELCSYLKTFGGTSQLTAVETEQFVSIAMAFNLNPFKREIYAIPYESNVRKQDGSWGKERKLSVITGYEVYLKRAERLGTLDGWEVSISGSGDDMKAILTVFRKDWSHPFKHEVYFEEVAKKDKDGRPMSMWKTMPKFMLKKVAVAQGFRLAFPDEFGGMPYTADELPDNMTAGFPKVVDASVEAETTTREVEYISPAKDKEQKPAPVQQQNPSGRIGEGEAIPGDYWKQNAAGKAAMLAEGCKAEKMNGVWICVRK